MIRDGLLKYIFYFQYWKDVLCFLSKFDSEQQKPEPAAQTCSRLLLFIDYSVLNIGAISNYNLRIASATKYTTNSTVKTYSNGWTSLALPRTSLVRT